MAFTVVDYFVDGADYLASGDLAQRWSAVNNATVDATAGRRGTGCIKILWAGIQVQYVSRTFANNQDYVIGLALYPTDSSARIIVADGATTQVDLRLDATQHCLLTRNGTTLGTSTQSLPLNNWSYIDLAVHVAGGTSGWAYLAVNGLPWLNLTGINTQASANAYANTVVLQKYQGDPELRYDDVMIRGGSGAATSDCWGDLGVSFIYPTADSVGADWTYAGSGVDAFYKAVDDATPNGDTDYIQSATAGAEQRFVFSDIPAGAVVRGVDVLCYARKTDAGVRTIKFYVVTNGDVRYSDAISLADANRYYAYHWAKNPVTTSAWTSTEVNAAQFGVRLDS